MPILKQLAQNGPPQGKRRLRAELTREMISAPLGDFRHTMHVGRGGEAFGDTSFLSRTGEGRGGEGRGGEGEGAGGQEGQAPRGAASSPPCPIQPAESVLSLFQVDLGPSMLSEVLGVMEKEPRSVLSPELEPPERGDERAGEGRASVPGEDNVVEGGEGEEEEEEEGGGFTFEDEEEQEDEEIPGVTPSPFPTYTTALHRLKPVPSSTGRTPQPPPSIPLPLSTPPAPPLSTPPSQSPSSPEFTHTNWNVESHPPPPHSRSLKGTGGVSP
ncbi:uncharacterized protein LOC144490422 [Mustelus asterias]